MSKLEYYYPGDHNWSKMMQLSREIKVMILTETIEAIHSHQLNPQSKGQVTVNYPAGTATVLSVQPDGSVQTRPSGANGPYELARVQGSSLVYAPGGVNGKAYLIPFAASIPND